MGRQKVVIIGHGYTSRLGIIRSLASSGCEIIVVSMVFHGRMGRFLRFEGGKPIDCCSKYVYASCLRSAPILTKRRF